VGTKSKGRRSGKLKDAIILATITTILGLVAGAFLAVLTPFANYWIQARQLPELERDLEACRQAYVSRAAAVADAQAGEGKVQQGDLCDRIVRLREKVDDDLAFGREPHISLLYVNGVSVLHEAREVFQRVCLSGGKVRFLLLDPTSEALKHRKGQRLEHEEVGRLEAELLASLYKLTDIRRQVRNAAAAADCIEIRFHDIRPDRNMILINVPLNRDEQADPARAMIQVNYFNRTDSTVDALDPRQRRIFPGPQVFLYHDAADFSKERAYFIDIWERGKPITLTGDAFSCSWPYRLAS
jgi:hypothetical protein